MDLKISYNWLKEYFPTTLSVQDFAKEFSRKSQTVDRSRLLGQGLGGVLVGEILSIERHPNADRLSIAQVDVGKPKPLQIIFGQAAVVKVGDRLPVAVAPIKLPTGQLIEHSTIRGVESFGMFCLWSELGMSDGDEAIFFDHAIKLGTSIVDALHLNDFVLDIEVTSNRHDAMSVTGLAREAAAVFGKTYKPKMPKVTFDKKPALPLTVEVKDKKQCRRYQAVVVDGVTIGPSPLWLQTRLVAAGLRPINNLVDITNYVLLEYGQPLHVFDYTKITKQKIVVRPAKAGEKITALDNKEYKLDANMLVIADAIAPIAIAGVMGGLESAAHGETKTIVFESASFDPVSIRKTGRALNLHSDSSALFEKNIHPESTFVALLRALELTREIAGGHIASPIIDSYASEYKPEKINFDPADVARHLGVDIPEKKIQTMLESLGFEVSGKKTFTVLVPWWRAYDVHQPMDLVEEIARLYGYHNLPTTMPTGAIPLTGYDPIFEFENRIKDFLAGKGYTELYSYSLTSPAVAKKAGIDLSDAIAIANPLNEELTHMRTSLVPQMLEAVAMNEPRIDDVRLFELSNVYLVTEKNKLPEEKSVLLCALTAHNAEMAFRQAKGLAEALARHIHVEESAVQKSFSVVDSTITNAYGIQSAVALVGLDVQTLQKQATTAATYASLPLYQSVGRDIAFVLNEQTTWQ